MTEYPMPKFPEEPPDPPVEVEAPPPPEVDSEDEGSP